MKRVFKLLSVLLVFSLLNCAPLFAETTYVAYQVTLGWDAATLTNGDAIPEGESVNYVVYRKLTAEDSEATEVGQTKELELVVGFSANGTYYLGVKAQWLASDESLKAESEVCWSDVTECVLDGETFSVVFVSIGSPGKMQLIK